MPNSKIATERVGIRRTPFDIGADSAPGSYFSAVNDGHRIFYNIWKPNGTIKAQVVFFHGLGEHVKRYDEIFSKLSLTGILVKGMDWRGHGRTVFRNANGVKGFHESFDQVFADMLQLLAIEVPGMRPGIPTFVAGHSMGGLLALSFVHHYKLQIPQLRGVIAQAPALSPGTPVPWWLQLIVKWIGGTWFGRFTQANNLALDGLCSYEPVVRQYLRDPLVHARISLRLAKDMLVHSEILKRLARQFSTPVIVYHSTRDQYTRADASEDWVIACGSKDKRFFGFPDDRVEHEIHNEPSVRDRIIRDYTAWILERSK